MNAGRVDVSIIIVNYKTRQLTLDAIESVYRSDTAYRYEIILVDNASGDGLLDEVAERYPEVVRVANDENVGYARANNQGMEAAQGRYILLLNSDTIVNLDTMDVMLRFMDENTEVGASGCKIVLPDGRLDKACKRGFPTPSASFYYAFGFSRLFPNKPRFNGYQLGHLDPDVSQPIDCLVGAFMLVRREAVEQVGGLDETFFMYGEDIDWCYRIKEAGWEIWYHPLVQITHYKGASSRRKPFKIVYEFHRAMYLFHRKHYAAKYSPFTNLAVYAGIGLKLGLALARNQLKRMGGS
ncbi:glycosyltransferase family 2 protein [Gorillibacterium timonense]|uniref:glycosyltransferase family 2 protein n=1 Tax=Gorillibacterium timonense TaxID=1689269 RepID=UPI00071D38CB|nr:glycosyltransferase family 2 protein [Gorillibacterium timonense]